MALPQFTAPVAVCHADAWLQQVHARAVDQLSSADWRAQLLHCRIELVNLAGWPSLELVAPLAAPSTELLSVYRRALADVLQQGADALIVGAPPAPEPGNGLNGLWRQVMGRIRGTRAAMAFWNARLVSLDRDRAVIELPSDEWLRIAHPLLSNVEDAMALVLGQRVAVVPTWPDADGGEG